MVDFALADILFTSALAAEISDECMEWYIIMRNVKYGVDGCRNQDEEETRQKFSEVDTNADGLLTWSEYAGKVFGYSADELVKFVQDSNPEIQTFKRVIIIHCCVGICAFSAVEGDNHCRLFRPLCMFCFCRYDRE